MAIHIESEIFILRIDLYRHGVIVKHFERTKISLHDKCKNKHNKAILAVRKVNFD